MNNRMNINVNWNDESNTKYLLQKKQIFSLLTEFKIRLFYK